MHDIWKRFQRDLTLNWKKTAALGVLFLFGCCFWVPMMTRAAVPRHAAATTKPSSAAPASPSPTQTASAPSGTADKDSFWSRLSKSLADDPLFQPSEMTSLTRDPFTPDEGEVPLPVLFAEDRSAVVEVKPVAIQEVAPTGLELRSTMVGRTRRVAIINGKLYQIGGEVLANGYGFRLAAIESDRVVLSSGDRNFELTLTRPKLTDVLNRDRAADLSAPRTP